MKFKLLTPHYIGGTYCPEGMEVGDGTGVPWPKGLRPSMHMEGLDSEGKKAVEGANLLRDRKAGFLDESGLSADQKAALAEAVRNQPKALKESMSADIKVAQGQPAAPQA